MKEHYIITIKADDRPGLLHLVTGILNRKLIPVISLTAAPTKTENIVLITIETEISERALQPLLAKIETVIEVYQTEAIKTERAIVIRAAYFKLDKAILESGIAQQLWQQGAQLIDLHPNSVLIAKTGREQEIAALYQLLDGPYLLGYSQTGLIGNSTFIGGEQSSVINRLAA